ncbi:hypothetical protein AGMMS50268_17580 [Spirochaetia bacterium]|nr:hypothetical protein AGMMS50268_17580 [Spirochaetia bacterium]
MKKLFTVILLLLTQISFQTLTLYAEDYQWDLINALVKNDFQTTERIISANAGGMSVYEKIAVVNFVMNYTGGENTLPVLELLLKHNIHPGAVDLYHAINRSHRDNVIQFILNDGVVPNGEILLTAAEKGRFNFVKQFVEMGADVNYRYPSGKDYADGMTSLLHAVNWGDFETVKLLVDHGANINVRTNKGSTPASIAHENNQTLIYDYLKEHGALDPEISQTLRDSTPPENKGPGIASLLNNELYVLSNGTYRWTGSSTELKLSGTARAGSVSYVNRQGKAGNGMFQTEGNTITIVMEGLTFKYRIDSNTSFSGNGETWVRVGN